MEKILADLQVWITHYGLKILAAIAIFIIGKIVAGILKKITKKTLKKSKVDDTLSSFLTQIIYALTMTFVVIMILGKLGVETASFVAVIGAAGLAVGLALQGSLSNFASGVLIILFRPFKIGDYIEAAGISGVVDKISIFHTEVKSVDNKKIIVPNSKITSDNIINYTAEKKRRVDIVVGVGYNDNLDKVREVIQKILSEEKRILKEPTPTIAVLELADSSVNFAVRPWVNTSDYWDVYFNLQEQIKKQFDKEGISIPFPQQDVYLHNVKD